MRHEEIEAVRKALAGSLSDGATAKVAGVGIRGVRQMRRLMQQHGELPRITRRIALRAGEFYSIRVDQIGQHMACRATSAATAADGL
jgi:hypothetical protein